MVIECYRCNGCGYVTIERKMVCPKCSGTEHSVVESDGKGRMLDFTTIYFPPDAYKEFAPYTSALVELNNGCKLFGIIEGEGRDLQPGSPVTVTGHDEERGGIFFRLG